MALRDDLGSYIQQTIQTRWIVNEGRVVPDTPDIPLVAGATKLTGTVLYADLAESTVLVNSVPPEVAARVYKCFLHCAVKIIIAVGGSITAFDGDRVMAVFLGDARCSAAARAALKINHAVIHFINPAFKSAYGQTALSQFQIRHGVGIDDSELFVARTGIRGANDLVWVGRAANHAAKICTLRQDEFPTWITDAVFQRLADEVKYGGSPRQLMWQSWTWSKLSPPSVHRSAWTWQV